MIHNVIQTGVVPEERHNRERRKRVVIESPFSLDRNYSRNVRYARACARDSILRGEAPYVMHIHYTQRGILNDNDIAERKLGIDCGLDWAEVAELTAVYTDLGIGSGMQFGIDEANRVGRPWEARSLGPNWEEKFYELLETLGKHPFTLDPIYM